MSANRFALTGSSGPGNCDADGAYVGTELDVLAWSQLTASSGDINLDFFQSGAVFFTWRPALQTPATSATVFAIAEDAGGDVEYARITGTPVNGSTAITNSSLSSIIVPFMTPPDPIQPGADLDRRRRRRAANRCGLEGQQARIRLDLPVRSIGGLSRTATASASASCRRRPRHRQRSIQDFLISQNDHDLYMGGVGYALNDDLHVVWTRSGVAAGHYPTSYGAYQDAAAANNTISARALLSAGTGVYAGSRWGDYVGVAQDPQVPNAVWQGNQFAKAGSLGAPNWGTEITQLQTGGTTFRPDHARSASSTRAAVVTGLSGPFAANTPRVFARSRRARRYPGRRRRRHRQRDGHEPDRWRLRVGDPDRRATTRSSSTINFPVGDNRANNLTIPLSTDGKLAAVYKAPAGRTTQLIFDVTGYFVAGQAEAEYKTDHARSRPRQPDRRPG